MPVAVQDDLSAAALADALDANVVELWRLICAALPQAEFHDGADATWFLSGSDVAPWHNQVLRVGAAPADTSSAIDRVLAAFAQRGVASAYVCVPLPQRNAHVAPLLEGRGLVRANRMPGLAVDLAALPDVSAPEGVTIARVQDPGELDVWARAYVDAFEMTDADAQPMCIAYEDAGFAEGGLLHHYVAFAGDRPVASATFFHGAGVCGVWHVGVMRNERRRGIGAAITAAGLYHARDLGYRAGTLYASVDGYSVYRRLGFQDCSEMLQYKWERRPQ